MKSRRCDPPPDIRELLRLMMAATKTTDQEAREQIVKKIEGRER